MLADQMSMHASETYLLIVRPHRSLFANVKTLRVASCGAMFDEAEKRTPYDSCVSPHKKNNLIHL